MHNRIRIARTNPNTILREVSDDKVLMKGQPFYDTKTNWLYIGNSDNKKINSLVGDDCVTTNRLSTSNYLVSENTSSDSLISTYSPTTIQSKENNKWYGKFILKGKYKQSNSVTDGEYLNISSESVDFFPTSITGWEKSSIKSNGDIIAGKDVSVGNSLSVQGSTTIGGSAQVGSLNVTLSTTIGGTTTSTGGFIGNLKGVADSSKEVNGVYIGSNKNILNNRLSLRASNETISSNFYPVFYHSISAQVAEYGTAITLSTALTTDAQSDGFDLSAFASLISVSLNMGGTVVQSKFIEFSNSSQIVFTDIKQNSNDISFYRVVLDNVSFTRPNLTFSLTEVVGYVVDSNGFRLLGKRGITNPWTITFSIISPAYINTERS